ncbi:MAG: DUF4886 domain-containing protein [Limisphaerales bacterium]
MRLGTYLALGLLLIAQKVCADEKLPALKVGDEVFSNVTVTAVTPTDIYFTYPGGMANAKLKKLGPELQKHFHYNGTNAMAVEKKQIEANAQYPAADLVSHPALLPSNEDRSAPTSADTPDSSSPRVLFIGNSYTSVNNLPQIFHDVAACMGHAPSEIKAVTPGGATLYQHFNSPDTLKLIDEGNWDIVVLQAQSQEAAMSEQFPNMRDHFLKGAAGLYDRIKAGSPHAKIIFYQTWARHADYWNDPKADQRIGNNPADMQARIRKWHQNAAAQKSGFLIAPVGDAWELNYKNPNAIRLHVGDNSHPAFNGSYLAALVIYGTIYHPPNLNVRYHGNLNSAETLYLQTIAMQVTH